MTVIGSATSGNNNLTSDAAADTMAGLEGNDFIYGGGGADTIYGDTLYTTNGGMDSTQAANSWGNLAVTGWTNTTNSGRLETWGYGFLGLNPDDGSGFIELDSGNGLDTISTNMALDTGKTYDLTIEHAMRAGSVAGEGFQVLVNGVVVATITPTTTTYFTSTTLTITGGAGTDVITIRELAATNNGLGNLLNGISITPSQTTVTASGLTYNDTLFGGAGNDKIDGQQGDDRIDGGSGDDYLIGGIGKDVFVGTDGGGKDVIKDFKIGDDLLDVSAMHDASGGKIKNNDVVIVSDGRGGSILKFPNGEWITLRGIPPSSLDTAAKLKAIGIPCFAEGTRIMTPTGERKIQNLEIGDMVQTLDRGYQPIRWIGSREVDATGHLAPIVFEKGVFGNDRRLLLSPLHRVLITSWQNEVLFNAGEMLVSARDLVNGETIFASPRPTVTYYHMMFEQHEIVYSNGMTTESFFVGNSAMNALEEAAQEEILEILPELRAGLEGYGHHARKVANHAESVLISKMLH